MDTENPFRALARSRGVTHSQLADELGISGPRLRNLMTGQAMQVPDDLVAPLTRLGLDVPAVRQGYAAWRDQVRGEGLPHGLDLARLTPNERAVVDAIGRGVRGVHNLAEAAGVPRPFVSEFLRRGLRPAAG